MRWIRLTASGEFDDTNARLTIDVLTDANHRVQSGLSYYGIWRDLKEDGVYPFHLHADGTVDLGTEFGIHRWEALRLHGRLVAQGQQIDYVSRGKVGYFTMGPPDDMAARLDRATNEEI